MTTLAQLGIVINSDGAKKGAVEVRQELASISNEAKKTTTSVVETGNAIRRGAFAIDALGPSSREAAQAMQKLREANDSASASVRRRSDEMQRAAQAAERSALREEAEAQRIGQAMARAEDAAYRMDAAMKRLNGGFIGSDQTAGRLRESMNALAQSTLKTADGTLTLASTLGSLAIGNAGALAVIAGIAAIGAAYNKLTEQTRKQKDEQERATKALSDFYKTQQQGVGGALVGNVAEATKKLLDQRKQLEELRQQIAGTNAAAPFTAPGVSVTPVGSSKDLQKQYDNLKKEIQAGENQLLQIYRKANNEYSSEQTARLADLVRSNAATVAEQQKLRDRLANLRTELAKTIATGGDPEKRQRLAADIATITAVYDAQAKAAAKASDASRKTANETISFAQQYEASLNDVRDKIAAYDAAQEKANAKLNDANEKIATSVANRAEEIRLLKEQIAQVNGTANAYAELTLARAQEKAVAEARAQLPKDATLDPATEDTIRAQVAEWHNLTQQLKEAEDFQRKYNASLKDVQGKLGQGADAKGARDYANAIRDAANAAGDLASAFGGTGKAIGSAIDQLGRLTSAIERMKAAQATSSTGVASGSVGALAASAGPVLTIAASFIAVANKMAQAQQEDAERRNKLQQDFAQSVAAFGKSITDGSLSTFQKAQQDQQASIADQVAKALAATGARFTTASTGAFSPTAAGLRELQASARGTLGVTGRDAGALKAFADALDAVIKNAEAAEKALRARTEAELSARTEDARVALLVAQGRTGEAEAMRRQLDLQRQIAEATKTFDGLDGLDAYIQLLKDADAAARAAVEAEKARQGVAFGLDLQARRQTLNGDARGAFVTRQEIARNSALAQAEELAKAGTITAEQLERLKVILGDEMVQAIKDFDDAVAKAKQQQLDDLAVRALVAQGKAREADQLRIEIANRNELAGVTDEAVRAEILRVQGLEAEARTLAATQAAADEAARAMRAYSDATLSISERMANALRAINPAEAARLDAMNLEIRRARELADATDDAMRARLRELYAAEDAARAQAELADKLDKAAKAAKELADFSSDLETQWLRATGQNFQADVRALDAWREEARKAAAANGLANDAATQRKIDEIYAARYNALIAATMASSTSAPVAAPGFTGSGSSVLTLGEDQTVFRSAQSITETSAMRLIDYAASQLAVQRDILAELRGQQSGRADRLLGPASASGLDQWLGTATSDQSRLVYGALA